MPSQLVMVEQEKIAPSLTCSICNKFFREATTITECLHSFCRKCIYTKINDEEIDYCPVCNVDLGCSPLDKLREDRSLQNLRSKIFSWKAKKVKCVAVEAEPSVSLQDRRDKDTSSPLVPSPPEVMVTPEEPVPQLRRRLKSIARMCPALRESILTEKPVKNVDDCHEKLSSSSTETQKSIRQDIPAQTMDLPDLSKNENQVVKSTSEWQITKPEFNFNANNSNQSSSGPVNKTGKFQALQQKRVQAIERFKPIWFSLEASNNQAGDSPLPQIPSRYLRVKDGSLTVSTIKKYLAQKLGLEDEEEVEIVVLDQRLDSTIQLQDLVEWWLQTFSPLTGWIEARAGSSAEDFVMALWYTRKSVSPSP